MNAIFQIRDDAIYTITRLSNENVKNAIIKMMRSAYRDIYQVGWYHEDDKRELLYNELTTKKIIDLYRHNAKIDLNSVLRHVYYNVTLSDYVISLFDEIEFTDQKFEPVLYIKNVTRNGRDDLAMRYVEKNPELTNALFIGMVSSKLSKYIEDIKKYSNNVTGETYHTAIYIAFKLKWYEIMKYLINEKKENIDPELIITCVAGTDDPELWDLVYYGIPDLDINGIIRNMEPDIPCYERLFNMMHKYNIDIIDAYLQFMLCASKNLELFKFIENKITDIVEFDYNMILCAACEEVMVYIMQKVTDVKPAIIYNLEYENIVYVKLLSLNGCLDTSIDLLKLISFAEEHRNLLSIALLIDIIHCDGLRLYNDSDKIIAIENLAHYNLYSNEEILNIYTIFINMLIRYGEIEYLRYTLNILRRRNATILDNIMSKRDDFLTYSINNNLTNDAYKQLFIDVFESI